MRPLLLVLLLLPLGLAATPGYVATLRGSFTTQRPASVTINGVYVEVLLHNTSIIAFRVPDRYITNSELLTTAIVKINVQKLPSLPLVALKDSFLRVNLDEFRERLINEQTGAKPRRPQSTDRSETDSAKHNAESEGAAEEEVEDDGGDDDGDENDEDEEDDGDMLLEEELDALKAETEQEIQDEKTEIEPDAERSEKIGSESDGFGYDEWDARLGDIERQLERNEVSKSTMQTLESAVKAGSARAEVSLASLLISGRRGLPRDQSRAARLLQFAAGKGHPDAQALLGFFHASDILPDIAKDIGTAVLMWTFAAEGGSIFAKMALGYRYFTGTDVAEDCNKAAKYYKEVADEVFNDARVSSFGGDKEKVRRNDPMGDIRPPMPHAIHNMDRKRLSDDMSKRVMGEANELVQFYRHSADRGDTDSQVVLGTLYYYGAYEMPQDIRRARKFFEAAAAKGRADAFAHLGFMDLQAGRNESAAHFLEESARHGDKLGLHGMGYITLHGIGVASNAQRAAAFFQEAAEKDHAEAMYNLAIMYSQGVGVRKSAHDSYQFFMDAARRFGHIGSNYNLGIRALKGTPPVKKDCTLAVKHLKNVSQRGIWNKILSKAFRAYERGSYADALYRYLMAAHAGIELAQYNAAYMYEKKLVRNSDGFMTAPTTSGEKSSRARIVEEALQLYSMSASQNSDESMVRMGDLAFGEAKDYERAAAAYERATKLRNAEAMFNLGWMHARGFGMNPDRHMAKRYFDQAMETDDDAKLPAQLAVRSLQYPENFLELLDEASFVVERCRHFIDGSWRHGEDGKSLVGSFAVTDAVVLTVLLGVLVIVVNARQRRMVQANEEAGEAEINEDNLDHRVENDAAVAQDSQARNEGARQQGDDTQAPQEAQR